MIAGRPRTTLVIATLAALVAHACSAGGGGSDAPATTLAPSVTTTRTRSPLADLPLPEPVAYRDTAEVTLADPAFEPLPGATADFGRLGGAVYQIEIPEQWNRRLVVWMHGFDEFAPVATVAPPDFRRFLVANGYAWAASSYSTTAFIPHRGADESAALWDYFVRAHGRPDWTYASGLSMGGWSSHIAAERYGDRYDGALALCGAAGTEPGLRVSVEYVVVGAFVAGVTQAEYEASDDVAQLVDDRIRPALDDPEARENFDAIMVDLTGGPRAYAVEGIRDEEGTNFERAKLVVAAGFVPPRAAGYVLGPANAVTSDVFNRDAIVMPTSAGYDEFAEGMDTTGALAMPLLTLHTTGDGQVPINQAQILRERVAGAGYSDLLVQRVVEDPGHCGFTTGEQEAAFQALVEWVERGVVPDGTDLGTDDLRELDRTFEDHPRRPAGSDQVRLRGEATLDGGPLDARFMGAVVRNDGLMTPCNVSIPPSNNGEFEIGVYTDEASSGCGVPGAEILLWTYVGDVKHFATAPLPWPRAADALVGVAFATADPLGAATAATEFSGEV